MGRSSNKATQATEGGSNENPETPPQSEENQSAETKEAQEQAEGHEQTAAERLAELETLLAEKEAQAVAAEERATQAKEAQEQAEAALAEVLSRKSTAVRVSHRNTKKQHFFEMNRSPILLRNGDPVDPEVVQFIKDNEIFIELEEI